MGIPERLGSELAGRYAIERELGAGGMATVYLARDLKHQRSVALKVLRPELGAALGAERFLQEIRITAGLDHPHILTLIDSGESDGFVWYVLPHVRGESLRERLNREKQLSVPDALRIAAQVASALEYAHRQGVIHRDIKPENILLHEGEAVVADFGIALAVHEAGGARLTGTGLSLGTPQYMSPEQAGGAQELDSRSDEYSLAAVVYEMLSGEPPQTGATPQVVIAKLLTEQPVRLRAVRPGVSEVVDRAVTRALAKTPADRFSSMADFVAALTAATPPPSRASARKVLLAVIALLAAVAFGIVLRQSSRRAPTPLTPSDEAPSVAVLPFDNLSGNPADAYLSEGMTEEVTGQLARVQGLKVISRRSAEALKGTRLTLRQIADTLGVRHILEGSIRHAGGRIKVKVDLIDAATDAHVWGSSYDRDLTDVFAVQEEIARTVADSLVAVVGARLAVGRVTRTGHPAAYQAYLMGQTQFYRRSREGFRRAREQFQRAIALDSSYAPSWAALSSVYQLWVFYAYPGLEFYEAEGWALALAERAIALDSGLAEGYAARGRALTRAWAHAEGIEADFRRALQLRPNSLDARQWYALFLAREGRHPEALAESDRALALDPLAPGVRTAAAHVAAAARQYEVAAQEAERALALEPTLSRARDLHALGQLLSRNPARCADHGPGGSAPVRAMCLHSVGRIEEGARVADSLRDQFDRGTAGDSLTSPVITARGLAEYHAWKGDAGQSLAWLERAFAISPEGEDFNNLTSGLYDKVRDEPRWKAGVERMREEVYQKVRRARARAVSLLASGGVP